MSVPTPAQRPAEYGTLGAWGAVSGLLIAFGVDPLKAQAVAGAVAAVAPAIITFATNWNRRKTS